MGGCAGLRQRFGVALTRNSVYTESLCRGIMMFKIATTVALTLMLMGPQAQASEPPIAYVKTVSGDARIVTAGQARAAAVGAPVHLGSTLQTGAQSSLGVTFRDETVMSFGPNTELTVDEYLYAPDKRDGKLGTRLAKGTLNYVSGAIARVKPEAVQVRTPTGTIGVRGTRFVVKVDDVTAPVSAR